MMLKMSKHYGDYVKSFKELGVAPFKKTPPIRKKLGDDLHILVFQDLFFSILSLSPKTYASYIYSWGKFIASESTKNALDVLQIDFVTRMTSKLFVLRLLKDKVYADGLAKTWIYYRIGIPSFTFIDEVAKTFRVKVEESEESWGLPNIHKKVCFFPSGFLAGNIESLIGKPVNVFETKCIADGENYDEFAGAIDLPFHKFDVLDKGDFVKIKRLIFNRMFSRKGRRPKLSDFVHLAIPQIFNLGVSLSSPGAHAMLYWVGRESGINISKRIKGTGMRIRLKKFIELMKYLKIGIFKTKSLKKPVFIVEESAFASGAKNFEKRICSYIAGLLAGFIEKSTGRKYNIIETKCIANGDEHCEFITV